MRRLLLFLLLSSLGAAELLVFNDTTGLPTCAYGCASLYNAQYECPSQQPECFCASPFVAWTPDGWAGCAGACTDEVGKSRVDAWMEATCGGVNNDDDGDDGDDGENGNVSTGNSTDGDTGDMSIIGDINTTEAENHTREKAAAQATKVRDWWKKNYPFFVLAFLVVTVPIVCYAIAIPLRKWIKRQMIKRRPRSQAYMENISPYTSVFASDGSRHSHISAAVLSPDPENGAVGIPPVTSVRQESWEARVRDQFKDKKTLGEKMRFWSRKG